MATPKSPRKRTPKTDSLGDVPPEKEAEGMAPTSGHEEIADAEVVAEEAAKTDDQASDTPDAVPVTDEVADEPVQDTPAEARDEPRPEAADAPEAAQGDQAPPQEAPAPEIKPQEAEQKRLHLEHAGEAEAAAPARRGSVFVPMLLGGVVAAGIGFGLARFGVPEGWPVGGSSEAVTALESRLAENARDIADMKARLEALAQAGSEDTLSGDLALLGDTAANALETANNAQHAFDGLQPRLNTLETDLATLGTKLTALESRPTGDPTVDSAMIEKLSADVDTMRAEVEAQKAAADEAAARLAQEVELARAEAEARAQVTLLQAAAAQVQAALQSGAPFDGPLAQLSSAGLEIPAPLTGLSADGAPTVSGLRDSFGEAARAALDVTRRENVGQSVTDRLSSFLQTQTGARSLTPREGDDPDAVLSRAENALRLGDLPAALALVSALPASAQDAMAGWVAQANTLLSAQDAAQTLSAALSER